MADKPNGTKGRDTRAPVFNMQLTGPNVAENVRELTALLREQTQVPNLSMATAVVMAINAELARRRGQS